MIPLLPADVILPRIVPAHRNRGTAMVMMVILSVVLTGLVMVVAMSAATQAQMSGASARLDQANAVAESAGQVAVWQFKHNNLWRQATAPTTLPTMVMANNTYSYGLIGDDSGATSTLYWPFSEGSGTKTDDASANSNIGTLVGGVSWTPQGKYGNGLIFDGSTGYITAGSASSTNISGSVTLAAWIKLASASQDQKIIGNQDGLVGGYKLTIFGQKVEMETHDNANTWECNRDVAGGTLLSVGVWYHVAGVYDADAGTLSSYVNGVLDRKGTGFGPSALAKTNGSVIIGREPWLSGSNLRFFCGTMDEVRVYNRALSAQELRALAVPSLHVHAAVSQTSVPTGAGAVVDFTCYAPPATPPTAPSLTIGGTLAMNYLTVSGDVQAGKATVNAASSINGHLVYKTSFSDPSNYLSLTYQGSTITPTANTSAVAPTIDYTTFTSQSVATVPGSSNQTITFNHVDNGVNVKVITGNCTDPIIDTTETSGTLYITGNLTITKNTTWGTAGNPVFLVVKGNLSQNGPLTLNGALYVGGNWSHADTTVAGDVVVSGNVTDNSTTGTTILGGGIPWFDPRGTSAPIPVPMYYTNYQGAAP